MTNMYMEATDGVFRLSHLKFKERGVEYERIVSLS